jgi:hypothetical protein
MMMCYRKIKPCPFCGSDNILLEGWEDDLIIVLVCQGCASTGPCAWRDESFSSLRAAAKDLEEDRADNEAIDKWNSRPLRGDK